MPAAFSARRIVYCCASAKVMNRKTVYDAPFNISFQLTLGDWPREPRSSDWEIDSAQEMGYGRAAQFIVEPVGKPCFGSRDFGK